MWRGSKAFSHRWEEAAAVLTSRKQVFPQLREYLISFLYWMFLPLACFLVMKMEIESGRVKKWNWNMSMFVVAAAKRLLFWVFGPQTMPTAADSHDWTALLFNCPPLYCCTLCYSFIHGTTSIKVHLCCLCVWKGAMYVLNIKTIIGHILPGIFLVGMDVKHPLEWNQT